MSSQAGGEDPVSQNAAHILVPLQQWHGGNPSAFQLVGADGPMPPTILDA